MTEKTKKLVLAALMCALTCVATMVIRIPTPTMGYIHPGDALVLPCAFLLGPVPGALAAGIGSMPSKRGFGCRQLSQHPQFSSANSSPK